MVDVNALLISELRGQLKGLMIEVVTKIMRSTKDPFTHNNIDLTILMHETRNGPISNDNSKISRKKEAEEEIIDKNILTFIGYEYISNKNSNAFYTKYDINKIFPFVQLSLSSISIVTISEKALQWWSSN